MVEREVVDDACRIIDSESAEWSSSAERIALAVENKIAKCTREKRSLPFEVFEALFSGIKHCNSEIAVIHRKTGKIFLPKRKPNERWAGLLHLPGTTHVFESLSEATERLLRNELDGFGFKLNLKDLRRVAVSEITVDQRGNAICQANWFVAFVQDMPSKARSAFYAAHEIPWGSVVAGNKDALRWFMARDFLASRWSWRRFRLRLRLLLFRLSGLGG